MSKKIPMQFPYGAVYFRKSNPPKQDWERDYAKAASDGMNIFRHWFMWGSIEVAPGVFDWEDYDRHMELAAKYGIKTIIAEIDTSIPEWAAADHPELLCEYPDGSKAWPEMGGSSATGGFFSAPCLDKPRSRELVANFLTKLAERYKGHPGLLGYDVWNECNYPHALCYCEDTYQAFREWLLKKHGSLEAIRNAWHRYSFADISQIKAPLKLSAHPDSMDWLEFRRENAHKQMQWRIDCIAAADSDCLISAHGLASTITNLPMGGSDDWSAAEKVEVYGQTWIPARHGSEPWRQWCATDLTRAGARGKTFWHAEMQGGPLWLQPQTTGRDSFDGRIVREQEIRIWNLTAMACGARGVLYLRWRPLLDGPLFGAFGPYDIDGGETERSRMASTLAKWANHPAQKELLEAVPVKGDIGLLIVPESIQASYLLSRWGQEDLYASMMRGAYRLFFDANIQADFVHIDDMDAYKCIYFPYPISLSQEHANKLKKWVANGGALVCEACPGLFDDSLHMGSVQPGLGLDELLGVKQKRMELMPDIFDDIPFEMDQNTLHGFGYLQTYALTTARGRGWHEGEAIAAENRYGDGKALIIGTYLSGRYFRHSDESLKRFALELLHFSNVEPAMRCKAVQGDIHFRMHANGGNLYLWALNTGKTVAQAQIEMQAEYAPGKTYWGDFSLCSHEDGELTIKIPSNDALVIQIKN
jgi:beta-galactosidase